MKQRVAGAALFGVGLFCLVVAAALAWLIVPSMSKLPYDLQPPNVVLDAPNATFVQAKLVAGKPLVEVVQGTCVSLPGCSRTVPRPPACRNNCATKPSSGTCISRHAGPTAARSSTPRRAGSPWTRSTGAAVTWHGQCYVDQKDEPCTAGNVGFSGQLYAFPFGTQPKTYQYYDTGLRTALPMSYRGTDDLDGLRTYRFEQATPAATSPWTRKPCRAAGLPRARRRPPGTMSYRANRTLWVEPMTGAIVGYREQQHRALVPDTGAAVPSCDATFQYNDATLPTPCGEKATEGRDQLRLYGRYLPIGRWPCSGGVAPDARLAWLTGRAVRRRTPAGAARSG